MNITIKDILTTLDKMNTRYTFEGNNLQKIRGFSDPGDYKSDTALWLGAPQYLRLKNGVSFDKVALLFCKSDMEGLEQFPNRVLCDDPRNTFMELVEILAEENKKPHVIASEAIVSKKAIIGKNVSIGSFSIIEDDVEINDNTIIGCQCVIHSKTKIGRDCLIMDNVVIGNPGYGFRKLPNKTHRRLPHLGGVIIGDNVEIGSLCNIDKGTFKDTLIADGVKIDSKSLIAHNVEIGENTLIINCSIGGNCKIGQNAELIGMRCKNRIIIESGSRVGIGSVVISDIPKNTTCFGNPSRIVKK